MTELRQILPKIARILNSLKKQGLIRDYALIGGMAVAARGFPRATKDLDFLINTEEVSFKKEVLKRMRNYGYIAELYEGGLGDPLRALIRILDEDKTPLVDLILIHWKWQEDMINAAEELSIAGISIPILKGEDLIVLKLKAGGARDLLDAEELIKVLLSSKQLNNNRLFLLSKRTGVDRKLKQILDRLNIL